MRALLVATILTTTPLATPALAQDQGPYAGIEGGLLFVQDIKFDYSAPGDPQSAQPNLAIDIDNAYRLDHKRGWDIDAIVGYDFGMFRVEGELGYKRASIKDIRVDPLISPGGGSFDADGRSTALSVMLNALFDIGDAGWGAYAGGGIGAARVRQNFEIDELCDAAGCRNFRGRDSGLAWQAIAGVRFGISENVSLGLKARHFRVSKLRYRADDDNLNEPFRVDGKWRSNSLLASLIFNFGRVAAEPVYVAPAAPPPAPVAPATQVCPDGSVILATDMCPMAPPPPPPPLPAPERG